MGAPARATSIRFALLVLVAWLALAACRDDERGVSGQPYVCVCVFPPEPPLEDVLLNVCAITAGEAMDLARRCLPGQGLPEASYCDCAEDTPPFCTLGECALRR